MELIGKKYGLLNVVEKVGREEYKCICDCGNEKIANKYKLLNNHTKSCGCIRGKNRIVDITGIKYGMLTPIKYLSDGKWECICDCGNKKIARSKLLKNGHTKSCGCLNSKLSSERASEGVDYLGKKIGELVVFKNLGSDGKRRLWLCKCDCGKEIELTSEQIRTGRKNCGNKFHLYTEKDFYDLKVRKKLRNIYLAMKQRCYNSDNPSYQNYGGRGITICDDWMSKDGFELFYKWSIDNGYSHNDDRKKQCSIDRIDVNKGYSPENCRWVSPEIQGNNKRLNVFIEYNGEKHTISEWSKITGIPVTTIRERFLKGKTPEECFKRRE